MGHSHVFNQFVETISKLRHPVNGCPWDLKQTHQSLIKYLIEETFEAVDAIQNEDPKQISDELGDILLQVVLHSVIAKEKNQFDIDDVVSGINQKMIRRHPHVFNELKVESIDEVKQNWEAIKKAESLEESSEPSNHYTFSNRILSNTALLSGLKIGEKTQKLDFDWDEATDVMTKVKEELLELEIEMNSNNHAKIEEEFGDLLFSMVQLGRHLQINPELSLRNANKKFINRFSKMEDLCKKNNLNFFSLPRLEKEKLWSLVKGKKNE